MQLIAEFMKNINSLQIIPSDIVEILLIAVVLYHLLLWVKNTRTWFLFKGIFVMMGFFFIAYVFNLNVILFIFEKALSVIVIALLIVFQPELRSALEQLGQKNSLLNFLGSSKEKHEGGYNAGVSEELIRAADALSKTRTGALIVIERELPLHEFVKTGIELDAKVTRQLLINIFEHNTPLHDGAVIIRDDRIIAATCYLPLSSDSNINKALGTRHRAAIGISEVSDSLTIVVSEETGKVSLAADRCLYEDLSADQLRRELEVLIAAPAETGLRRLSKWFKKGGQGNEEKTSE